MAHQWLDSLFYNLLKFWRTEFQTSLWDNLSCRLVPVLLEVFHNHLELAGPIHKTQKVMNDETGEGNIRLIYFCCFVIWSHYWLVNGSQKFSFWECLPEKYLQTKTMPRLNILYYKSQHWLNKGQVLTSCHASSIYIFSRIYLGGIDSSVVSITGDRFYFNSYKKSQVLISRAEWHKRLQPDLSHWSSPLATSSFMCPL